MRVGKLPSFERVIAREQQSFAIARYRGPIFPFRWHIHPEVELMLAVAGRGQRFVGDNVADFNPGDLVLMAGGLPHTWHSLPRPGVYGESLVVQFLPHFLGETFYNAPEMEAIRGLLHRSSRGVVFSPPLARAVAKRLNRMLQLKGMAALTELLSVLSQLAAATPEQAVQLSSHEFEHGLRTSDQRRIDQVFNLMQSRLNEPLTQREVAEAIYLSPGAFGRFFKRTTGHTFVSYLHELRIGRACRLLIETDRSIIQIGMDSGFKNLSHFNRLFLRLKGMSPREFRKSFSGARAG